MKQIDVIIEKVEDVDFVVYPAEIEELCGYGATEEEAVADFLELVVEIGDQFEDADGQVIDWENVEIVYQRVNC
jgi:predicted RNase H-like HicB family nuclease